METKAPWELASEFFSNWNLADISWLAIGFAIILFTYKLDLRPRGRNGASSNSIFVSIAGILFWIFAFIVVLQYKVSFDFSFSKIIPLALPAVLTAASVYILLNVSLKRMHGDRDWLQITSKTLITAVILAILVIMTGDIKQGILSIAGVALGSLIGILCFNIFSTKKIPNDFSGEENWTPPEL
jgi:uncharacterized membrane protein YhaH (DUF805 family)